MGPPHPLQYWPAIIAYSLIIHDYDGASSSDWLSRSGNEANLITCWVWEDRAGEGCMGTYLLKRRIGAP